jgi:hypothetical protein
MRVPRLINLGFRLAHLCRRLNTLLGSNKDADYRIAHSGRQRFAPLFIGLKVPPDMTPWPQGNFSPPHNGQGGQAEPFCFSSKAFLRVIRNHN